MKKLLLIVAILLMGTIVCLAQTRKGTISLRKGVDAYRLYVSFKDGINLGNSQDYEKDITSYIPEFKELSAQYAVTVRQAIIISPQKLAQLEVLAIKNTGSGKSVTKLTNIVELKIENPTSERLLALGQALEKYSGVEYCTLMPAKNAPFPYDIPPATPYLIDEQNYVSDYGVDMAYAWDLGLSGQNMKIRDLEGNLNPLHEEFNERNAYVAPELTVHPEYLDHTHGTGVVGVLYADPGDYGVTGLCHGADEVILYPVITTQAGYDVPYTLSKCLENSTEGDFVIFELQTWGALGEFGPIEYELPVWDLTKAATDAGIVVFAAAGNGAENLDAPEYEEYRARGNSGAVIIGAGSPDEFHDRLDYSTYGERVDLQGWGFEVLTAGTGSAYIFGEDDNQTYTMFSGTSSATPIVTACAVVLQSHYHATTGNYLTGIQLKEILQQTGKPQGFALEGNVGPLPSMPEALEALDALMGINSVEKNTFIAYPNPVNDKLTLTGNFSGNAKAEIYNTLGQSVYTVTGFADTIDFSSFSRGVYIVKVTDNGKSETRKIVKN